MLPVVIPKENTEDPTRLLFECGFMPMRPDQIELSIKEGNLTLHLGCIDESSAKIAVPFELTFEYLDLTFRITGVNSHVSRIYVKLDHYYGYFSLDEGFYLLRTTTPGDEFFGRFDGITKFFGFMCRKFDWPNEPNCFEFHVMHLIDIIAVKTQFMINSLDIDNINWDTIPKRAQAIEDYLAKLNPTAAAAIKAKVAAEAKAVAESKMVAPAVPATRVVPADEFAALQRKIVEVNKAAVEFQRLTAELNAMMAALAESPAKKN